MQIRWLGWAGVEVEARGQRIVIDPLQDPLAVFGWLGEQANAVPLPQVVAPQPGANAGLLTHLHRDHADAAPSPLHSLSARLCTNRLTTAERAPSGSRCSKPTTSWPPPG